MAPILRDELLFTTQQYSYVFDAFQLAYTVMQPLCGFIVDLIGLKLGFALFSVAWSIFNCLSGFAVGGGLEHVGAHAIDQRRDHLMREAADAEQSILIGRARWRVPLSIRP
jgi:MFS family permease